MSQPHPRELLERLSMAWDLVLEAELPSHVQPEALRLIFSHLATQDIPTNGDTAVTDDHRNNARLSSPNAGQPDEHDTFVAQLARKADLSTDRISQMFLIHDRKIELIPLNKQLGDDSASRFRNLAVLMVPALMAKEGVDSIDGVTVKKIGETHGASDTSGHFAKYVGSIAGYSYVGPRSKKAFRLTPGWEDTFAETISEVLGESSA